MTDQKLVRANEAFETRLPDGRVIWVSGGEIFDAADPVVQGREHLFGELVVRSSMVRHTPAAATETGTAAPGSKRALSRASRSGKAAGDSESPKAAAAEDGDTGDA